MNKEYWKYVFKKWLKQLGLILSYIATAIGIIAAFKGSDFIKDTIEVDVILYMFFSIVLISFIFSLPKSRRSYKVEGLNGCTIELIIGDMFNEKCDFVIPTNTSFDTCKDAIKSSSVQGQFCKRYCSNNTKLLNTYIEEQLDRIKSKRTDRLDKIVGNKFQYPLNTIITFRLEPSADSQRFHWIAINDFGPNSQIVPDSVCLHESFNALWNYLSTYRVVRDLCIPILGTGLTSVNQPVFDILEYCIDSFIIHSKNGNIVKTLKIYFYPSDKDVFDNFNIVSNYIKYRVKNSIHLERKSSF